MIEKYGIKSGLESMKVHFKHINFKSGSCYMNTLHGQWTLSSLASTRYLLSNYYLSGFQSSVATPEIVNNTRYLSADDATAAAAAAPACASGARDPG